MSWKLTYQFVLVMALLAVLAGCTAVQPAGQAPAAADALPPRQPRAAR